MSDVILQHTPDGGEITCENGVIAMDEGVVTAVYVSLFGGNEGDSGGDEHKAVEWWGNKIETDSTKKLRSETQHLLRSIPATSGNLRLIEDAVGHDLAWMVETKLASFVGCSASIPALNTVKIDVKIEIQNELYEPSFSAKWGQA